VLFIMADDMNDWISPLVAGRGLTPSLDRLAARGTVFPQAYCAAPACGPSRTALLTGVAPTVSGIYFNNQPIELSDRGMQEIIDLPGHFKSAGYLTVGLGKLFHHGQDQDYKATSWTEGFFRGYSAPADALLHVRAAGSVSMGEVWPGSWGWYSDDWDRSDPLKMQQDTENSIRAAELLHDPHDRPFFIAVGIFRPHSKWYVPKRYYDLYPTEQIPLPEGWRDDDVDDLPAAGRWLAQENVTSDTHRTLLEHGLWRQAMQAYLASITYADEQIGRLLDALGSGPNARNTIVVFTTDHGYHLGEKEHWNKFTLWERSTRVPLIIARPGDAAATPRRVASPISLLDLYPTLIDLAGLPPPASHRLAGESLLPLLTGQTGTRSSPVVTTYGRGNHTVRDARWRYIRYRNGDEELYDHTDDPHEWCNLAADPELRLVMDRLAAVLPTADAPDSPYQEGRSVNWIGGTDVAP